MAFSIKIETYKPLDLFESWLDQNARNPWEIEFSGLSDIDDGKAMNKAQKTLIFHFNDKGDKDTFKRAYLKGSI
jgi:hypothetical protein